MLIHHRQHVEAENAVIESGRDLLLEARAMAMLIINTYFPYFSSVEDVTCCNCQNFVNQGCGGRRLDFQGVIDCMVNIAINGPVVQKSLDS